MKYEMLYVASRQKKRKNNNIFLNLIQINILKNHYVSI